MKISSARILELNEEHGFIKGLCERESTNPEGSGFDLRVGRVEKIIGGSYLGVKERKSAETELIADYNTDGEKRITLGPRESYLVSTMEEVNAPSYKVKYDSNFPEAHIGIDICARTSLMRAGVVLLHGRVNPGYHGPLTLAIHNTTDHPFDFELGARMFDIEFVSIAGDLVRAYAGQHQGGRITSQGETETQN